MLVAALWVFHGDAAALTLLDAGTRATISIDVRRPAKTRFTLSSRFEPGTPQPPDVAGIPVSLAVGPFSRVVPAGRLRKKTTRKGTTWVYRGTPIGLRRMSFTLAGGRWSFTATGSSAALASATNPLRIALDLGSDGGAFGAYFATRATRKRKTLVFPPAATDDADADGISAARGDCDDQNPAAYPGATERCDGVDNDCNDQRDEGFTLGTVCAAGLGACRREGVLVCRPDGFVAACATTPGVPEAERCGNQVDDDCDGETDEGFSLGAACTVGAGACRRGGVTVCAADGMGTVCDATPAPECEPGPAIAIVDPPNLASFNRLRITVSGTVGPEAVAVECNGTAAQLNGGFRVTLTLEEGNAIVTCVARDAAGRARTASATVTVDTQPPRVTITAPGEGTTVPASPVMVAGLINDVVVGTVNQQEAQVTCNGVRAEIANRSFLARGVPLTPGANTITCVGTDRAGNADTHRVTVTLAEPSGAALRLVSGDGQRGAIDTALTEPLVVALTDDGAPIAGKVVVFEVLDNDGTLAGGVLSGRRVAVLTDAAGRAQVRHTLGTWAGAGSHRVRATAPGHAGEVLFSASATPGAPADIVVDSGGDQEGAVGERLPRPFVAGVVDAAGNRLAGVPVTFTVVEGGGDLGGQPALTVPSDSDGLAAAVLALGPDEGAANNVVAATFTGNAGLPARFTASGMVPGSPADTIVSGVVLDNTDQPIPGVTVGIEDPASLTAPRALLLSTRTDEQGQFLLEPAPVGHVVLQVDGATAARPGAWPRLEYDMVTIAGRRNTVGMPIYLLPIDVGHGLAIDDTHGGTITLPDVPGFSLTIAPGSVTFLDGTTRGTVSVTMVHPDKVPMVPNFGQQPRFVVTIQPAGVHFNPPAPMTIPNADGLAPGEKREMYSFDHDLGQFVSIGPGTVSEDGSVIASDPGVGVMKGGWHFAGRPTPTGTMAKCDDSNPCTDDIATNAGCQHNPVPDGMACGALFGVIETDCGPKDRVRIKVDKSCGDDPGMCLAGKCSTGPWDAVTIAAGGLAALQKVCSSSCIGEPLRTAMRQCLRVKKGILLKCSEAQGRTPCAKATGYDDCSSPSKFCSNEVTFYPVHRAVGEKCWGSSFAATTLHELVHALGCVNGGPKHNELRTDRDDKPHGCAESCFPGSSGTYPLGGNQYPRGLAGACK